MELLAKIEYWPPSHLVRFSGRATTSLSLKMVMIGTGLPLNEQPKEKGACSGTV